MTMILLSIGLVLTPFYELVIKLFPYSVVMTPDTRVAKLQIGMMLALAVGLYSLFSGEIRRCKNIWILLFLVFIPISIHLSPQYNIELNGVMSPNYWVWKPFVLYLSFFLMFMSVHSLNITKESFKSLLNVMVWCGFVMAVYVLLQNFGWDQFFNKRLGAEFVQVTKPVTVGNLGNSTVVSPYIAMIIPLALYLRRWVFAGVMVCAVIACHSTMATGAMIVSLLAYACLRGGLKAILGGVLVGLTVAAVLSFAGYKNPKGFDKVASKVMNDNGRVAVWRGVVEKMKNGEFGESKSRYPFTGIGPGAYSILMQPLLKTKFAQVHNEYLQVFCEVGLIGLFLFLMAIAFMVNSVFRSYLAGTNVPEFSALLASFICIALVACGTFIWQLSPHNFYTTIIVGLLHNRRLLKGELE